MPIAAPIDYSLNTPSPDASLTQGLTLGNNLQQRDFALQQQELAVQQQQLAAQRQAQQRRDLADLSAKVQAGTAGARDYAAVVAKYPDIKDSFKQSWDALSTEQQQQRVQTAAPIFAAFQSGRPDLAEKLLQDKITALKNSGGSAQDIQADETWLKMVQQAPEHAQVLGGGFLASVMGDKFEATFGKAGSEARDNAAAPGLRAKTAAETYKANEEAGVVSPEAAARISEINSRNWERGARIGLDTEKLAQETGVAMARITAEYGQPKPDARKLINDSTSKAITSANTAAQMRGLADQFEKADPHSFAGATGEALAQFTGQQDYVTELRKEYTRLRATSVNALLPPGPASDKDILNAQAGFLPATAKASQIASWLRGMSKLQDYEAKYEGARGEWAAAVGHLGKATKDIEIDGRQVAAGTTLIEFLRQTLASPGPATQPPANPAGKRGYMKYGQ